MRQQASYGPTRAKDFGASYYRPLWPLMWLLGFRIWEDEESIRVKIPGWWPNKQKLADDIARDVGKSAAVGD